jgi:hypothetical protein
VTVHLKPFLTFTCGIHLLGSEKSSIEKEAKKANMTFLLSPKFLIQVVEYHFIPPLTVEILTYYSHLGWWESWGLSISLLYPEHKVYISRKIQLQLAYEESFCPYPFEIDLCSLQILQPENLLEQLSTIEPENTEDDRKRNIRSEEYGFRFSDNNIIAIASQSFSQCINITQSLQDLKTNSNQWQCYWIKEDDEIANKLVIQKEFSKRIYIQLSHYLSDLNTDCDFRMGPQHFLEMQPVMAANLNQVVSSIPVPSNSEIYVQEDGYSGFTPRFLVYVIPEPKKFVESLLKVLQIYHFLFPRYRSFPESILKKRLGFKG